MDLFNQNWNAAINFIEQYIDLDYSLWLWRILWPLIVTFLLPCLFVVRINISFIILYVYKLNRQVILHSLISEPNFWDFARKLVAAVWDAHGRIYHGYEVIGMENLPTEGPALIVFYHGAIPINIYYFIARVCLQRNRFIYSVGDRFLWKVPGWGLISDATKVCPGTVQSCSNILKEGHMLAISPGGVYEAQFGNHNYELLWRNRVGFAKVAIEAKAPIKPCFLHRMYAKALDKLDFSIDYL